MKNRSWKTTAAGLGAILTALGMALTAQFDADPATVADWPLVVTAVLAGIGLLSARDDDKSSEQVGAAASFEDESAKS